MLAAASLELKVAWSSAAGAFPSLIRQPKAAAGVLMNASTSAVTVMGSGTSLVVPVATLAVDGPYVSASAVAKGRFEGQVLCTGASVSVLLVFGAVVSKRVSVAESAPPVVGMLQLLKSNLM